MQTQKSVVVVARVSPQRDILVSTLEQRGYQVTAVSRKDTAFDLVSGLYKSGTPPAFLVADFHLDEGYDAGQFLTRQIKECYPRLPIAILKATTNPDQKFPGNIYWYSMDIWHDNDIGLLVDKIIGNFAAAELAATKRTPGRDSPSMG